MLSTTTLQLDQMRLVVNLRTSDVVRVTAPGPHFRAVGHVVMSGVDGHRFGVQTVVRCAPHGEGWVRHLALVTVERAELEPVEDLEAVERCVLGAQALVRRDLVRLGVTGEYLRSLGPTFAPLAAPLPSGQMEAAAWKNEAARLRDVVAAHAELLAEADAEVDIHAAIVSPPGSDESPGRRKVLGELRARNEKRRVALRALHQAQCALHSHVHYTRPVEGVVFRSTFARLYVESLEHDVMLSMVHHAQRLGS